MRLLNLIKSCILICLGIIPAYVSSHCCEETCFFSTINQGWSAEFRVAYFSPDSKRFTKIYSRDLVDYQVEISKEIFTNCSLWFDVDYLSKKGHSYPLHDHTRINLVPLALGLNYQLWCQNGWIVYVGAGGNYTHLKIHDHSHYVKEHTSKWQFGGTFKSGIKKVFCNGITLSIFCDYFLQKFHFSGHSHCSGESSGSCTIERTSLNASGIKAGIGLGYVF